MVLVGDEVARPYERPPLSEDYLRGEKGFEAAAGHEQGLLRRQRHRAARLHDGGEHRPKASEDVLSTGERLGYDRGRRGLTCPARESSRAATHDALRAHGQHCGPISPARARRLRRFEHRMARAVIAGCGKAAGPMDRPAAVWPLSRARLAGLQYRGRADALRPAPGTTIRNRNEPPRSPQPVPSADEQDTARARSLPLTRSRLIQVRVVPGSRYVHCQELRNH